MDRWSYDKIVLFYGLAQKRMRREAAAKDVRLVRCLRVAIASAMSKKGGSIAEKFEADLMKIIREDEDNQESAVARFLEALPKEMVKHG